MIDVRPAASRFHTEIGWLDSWHCFSFGRHYDPAEVGHGLLLVLNDDRVAPGAGFATHAHRDMEIVTWVLEGALEHQDSAGHHGIIRPGEAQRMSAGRGIRHSEMNASATEPLHFLQMWVVPDRAGVEPGYEQVDVGDRLASGALVCVAAGDGSGAVHIHQAGAAMWVARLDAGQAVTVPAAPFAHLFMGTGAASLDGTALSAGDAARLRDAGEVPVTAVEPCEIVIWTSDAEVRR